VSILFIPAYFQGELLTAYELISSGETVSRAEIREVLSGNLCRCTGYHAIVDAVEAVSAKSAKASKGGRS
jgi:carbon-monoxide dehydrogenase small subunit